MKKKFCFWVDLSTQTRAVGHLVHILRARRVNSRAGSEERLKTKKKKYIYRKLQDVCLKQPEEEKEQEVFKKFANKVGLKHRLHVLSFHIGSRKLILSAKGPTNAEKKNMNATERPEEKVDEFHSTCNF